jgi:hypothetical protein
MLVMLLVSGSVQAEEIRTMAYEDVKVGMTGHGLTVFAGTKVESFSVEIIGKLYNVAPKRNVILGRLSGGPLAQTGVMQGMSGSPVYLDGKLAGAVAYTWGFAKEPLCGITPIDEMLDILTREPSRRRASAAPYSSGIQGSTDLLIQPTKVHQFFKNRLAAAIGSPMQPQGLAPIRTPLVLGAGPRRGLSGAALKDWEELFFSFGFAPARAAAGGSDSKEAATLIPGSAVGVQLVRGDVEMSGIGTVTFVQGNQVLAFGHPMLMLGPTALPMTGAEVHALFPSQNTSFKLAGVTGQLGSIVQDRYAGIAGTLGKEPPMVPISVTLTSGRDRETVFEYEIAEDSLITPIMLYLSLLEILSTSEKQAGDITLDMQAGSQIRLEGGLNVQLENLFSGEQSELMASGIVAYMTYLLMNNPDRPSRVEGIDLTLKYSDSIQLATIERIWVDKYKVAPGETVPLYVVVRPFRGDPFTEVLSLEIPEEAAEGKAILQVGDAATLSRMEVQSSGSSFQPTSLEQLIFLLNRIRTNNNIYATLIRPDSGAFVAGHRLPNLPPSVATLLLSDEGEEAGARRMRLRGILEVESETRYALRGYQKVILDIRR